MALTLPRSLSPSALSSFTACGLQFRFASVERLPEAPSLPAVRGTLVHAALEHLFTLPGPERVPAAGPACVDAALARLATDDEWLALELDRVAAEALAEQARQLVEGYFRLEDPRSVHAIGLELKMEARVGDVVVRGIIDRLDLVDGDLVVTDYKTGRAPGDDFARTHMTGVHLYSLMCEQAFGRRPARVRLLHLAEPVAIVARPSEQSSRGLSRRVGAVWRAIESACATGEFQPRPSARCNWCSFRAWCPAFGGDPERAHEELSALGPGPRNQLHLSQV